MSKWTAEVNISYTIEYDDTELEGDDDFMFTEAGHNELRQAREELVIATYTQADCDNFFIDITEHE